MCQRRSKNGLKAKGGKEEDTFLKRELLRGRRGPESGVPLRLWSRGFYAVKSHCGVKL